MGTPGRFVIVLFVCLIGAFAGGFTAQWVLSRQTREPVASDAKNDHLSATRFALVTTAGHELAALETTESGFPVLRLWDPGQTRQVFVGFSTHNEPIVSVKSGADIVGVSAGGDLGPSVGLLRGDSQSLSAAIGKDGPVLRLDGTDSDCWVGIIDNLPDIGMNSESGRMRVGIDRRLGSRLVASQSGPENQIQSSFAFAVPASGGPQAIISDSGGTILWSEGNPGVLTQRK